MTRSQIIELHDKWTREAYNLQRDLKGTTRGAKLLKGIGRARSQTHAQCLVNCASQLQEIINDKADT